MEHITPIRRALTAAFDRYWLLPRTIRRMVGWCAVILVLTAVGLVGYGLYRGGRYVVECVCALFEEEPQADTIDPNAVHLGRPHRDYSKAAMQNRRHFNWSRDFNDLQEVQIVAAQQCGIRPIANRTAAEQMKGSLVEIRNSQYYKVDHLTHSIPYLVPTAADLLTEIGRRFQEYTGDNSRFIITSLLRTEADVKSLKHGNGNASKQSCHRFATTVDITYNRFDRRSSLGEGRLKEDLARALYDLQTAGYCYVKYERKQACFHITVRP